MVADRSAVTIAQTTRPDGCRFHRLAFRRGLDVPCPHITRELGQRAERAALVLPTATNLTWVMPAKGGLHEDVPFRLESVHPSARPGSRPHERRAHAPVRHERALYRPGLHGRSQAGTAAPSTALDPGARRRATGSGRPLGPARQARAARDPDALCAAR